MCIRVSVPSVDPPGWHMSLSALVGLRAFDPREYLSFGLPVLNVSSNFLFFPDFKKCIPIFFFFFLQGSFTLAAFPALSKSVHSSQSNATSVPKKKYLQLLSELVPC